MDDPQMTSSLYHLVSESQVRRDEPLVRHTTFEIGGPADYFVMPETAEELKNLIEFCRTQKVPYFLLGRGSDVVFSDEGFRGVVISTTEAMTNITLDPKTGMLTCMAGLDIREVSEFACEHGLSGLEFACGIPGSIGGACFMNAGAYGGCIADVVHEVKVLTPEGEFMRLSAADLNFGYRASRIQDEGLIVISATFALSERSQESIRAVMDDLMRQRTEKQPLELPSAGSTFKRPEGYFAGKLISDAGLQGFQIGGAAVSKKHAGFVVNVGGATERDVRDLIAHIQAEVFRQFGVQLEPEVRFVSPEGKESH